MKRAAILSFTLCLFVSRSSYAVKDFAEGTFSASAVSLGSTNSDSGNIEESSMYNPALLGLAPRPGGAFGFGFSSQSKLSWAHVFYPRSLGVFGLSAAYLQSDLQNPVSDYAQVQLGYGKELRRNLFLGFYLTPSFTNSSSGSAFSFGFNPGLFYNTGLQKDYYKGMGIYNLGFYVLTRNLAFNFGEATENAPEFSFHIGAETGFFQHGIFSTSLFLEAFGISKFDTLPVHIGLRWRIWRFNANIGYMFSETSNSLKGASVGAGFKIPLKEGSVQINYALLPRGPNDNETYHFISLAGNFGVDDKDPPEIEIRSDRSSFSPNFDGTADYATFYLHVKRL